MSVKIEMHIVFGMSENL